MATRPLRMRLSPSQPDLSSSFKRLAVQSRYPYTTQREHESALGIAQAVRAIEECYTELPHRHLRMLRSFAERSARHARRVVAAVECHTPRDSSRSVQELLIALDHSVQLLAREVVRGLRRQQLELRWPTGETSRPNERSLKGTRAGLSSFVNRVCYAVTRELSCFALPLLPLAPASRAEDREVDPFGNSVGLGIWWDDSLGWIVEELQEVGSSEVSTEVDEGRMVESWEDVETKGGCSMEEGACCDEFEEDTCEDDSLGEDVMVDG